MANNIDIITTSLEALIQRASNPNNPGPDTAAIDAFCGLVNQQPDCTSKAAKLITAKAQSLQEREALQALMLLETCMKRCTSHFLPEVGKFRFLNELIKLVSPKYLGAHTPEVVRNRVLELMHMWTLVYPKEIKIKEAYNMLKTQGVIKEDPVIYLQKEPVIPRNQDSIFQDEEKSLLLQKLLRSKNPQDLQAANRLIKTMVKEEERRNEEKWRSHKELETAVNNCRLLSEMLESYQEGVSSDQELELIRELHNTCQNLRPTLFKLANANTDPGFCHEVLTVNDELGEVFVRYNSLIKVHLPPTNLPNLNSQPLSRHKEEQASSSLLDLSPSPMEKPSSFLTDLSNLVDLASGGSSRGPEGSQLSDSDVLNEVFSSTAFTGIPQPLIQDSGQLTVNNLNLLPEQSPAHSTSNKPPVTDETKPEPKGLEELEILSRMLMEQSLQEVANSKYSESKCGALESNSLDDDVLLNLGSSSSGSDGKEIQNGAAPLIQSNLKIITTNDTSNDSSPMHSNKRDTSSRGNSAKEDQPVLPLGDISLPIEAIRPSGISPFQGLDDKNGITIVIHLAKDRPRPDVAVYVVTTSSKSQSPLSHFLFQPVVPKYCRLRLLPPSNTDLPPHNPFLPPSAITQVMLIASPTKEPIPLKFVISYTMDEETITEMGDVERLLTTET